MDNTKKKGALLFRFAVIFAVFALAAIAAAGISAYAAQTEVGNEQRCVNIKNTGRFLAEMAADDSEEVLNLRSFLISYPDQADNTVFPANTDKTAPLPENYTGMMPYTDTDFSGLSYEDQAAYSAYVVHRLAQIFEKTVSSLGISYAYLALPADDGMNRIFLIGNRTELTEDRRAEILRAYSAKEDFSCQFRDDGYGKIYAHFTPVSAGDSILGIIVTESVPTGMDSSIVSRILIHLLVIFCVLTVCAVIALVFINRHYISRLRTLEAAICEYSEGRNVSSADKIEENADGSHEFASLSKQTAGLIRGIDRYISDVEKTTAEKVRTGADLNVATKIQADMLPTKFPQRKELEIYAAMTPAKEVGGDFYDFFKIDSDHIGLVMADVSGKGVPAALFMVIAKTLIQDRALMGRSPARVFEYANNRLCENNASGLFVTAWLGVLEISTGKLTYSNAGHEYPAIRRSGGNYELVTIDNAPPLAAMEDMDYDDEVTTLAAGDSLFLYTDGVPEAKSPDKKRFGTNRMLEILNENKDLTAEKMIKKLKDEIDSFSAEDPFDDVTMLCVNYFGK